MAADRDKNWQRVHRLVKQGSALLASDRHRAIACFEEALAHCQLGASYSDYDELYAYYGLVDADSHLIATSSGEARRHLVDACKKHAEKALAKIPMPDDILANQSGLFQLEVTRRAGNALAWYLMEGGDSDGALRTVDRAIRAVRAPEHDFIRDTKARILLAAGRTDEAYRLVWEVMTAHPGFSDLGDIEGSTEYRSWRERWLCALPLEVARRFARIEELLPEIDRAFECVSGRPGPAASSEQIAVVERRCGRPLPQDYRAFLSLHDGWTDLRGGLTLLSTSELLDRKLQGKLQAGLRRPARRSAPRVCIAADAEEDTALVLEGDEMHREGWRMIEMHQGEAAPRGTFLEYVDWLIRFFEESCEEAAQT